MYIVEETRDEINYTSDSKSFNFSNEQYNIIDLKTIRFFLNLHVRSLQRFTFQVLRSLTLRSVCANSALNVCSSFTILRSLLQIRSRSPCAHSAFVCAQKNLSAFARSPFR